ncbi:MAG: SAP domain-containing protein, partial [Oscillospiraceae bacterium]|nr:SAP domain-containing protein [Oscillospiraceae bacterium]
PKNQQITSNTGSKANRAKTPIIRNSLESYADSSSISPDERPYYQPDNYYTYYSYPGTEMATKVVTFEERKKISFPSERGLYVAEILLLDYCETGKYPKPKNGYPGLWWFKYGIRDVGHTLESLEQRGFIRWASKKGSLNGLKVDELKQILNDAGLSTKGKKTDLVERIVEQIPEENIIIPNYCPKYELTELGKQELEDNGYVPYMHKHKNTTTEDGQFGETFNVWSINKVLHNKKSDWRTVVGEIEYKRFGVDMANEIVKVAPAKSLKKADYLAKRDEMRSYLSLQQPLIKKAIRSRGDGFQEGFRGIQKKAIDQDKEALIDYYIAIGKKIDAPAYYREAAILLRKYGMYEEELEVIEAGLKNVPKGNTHWNKLLERKGKVLELIKKEQNKH